MHTTPPKKYVYFLICAESLELPARTCCEGTRGSGCHRNAGLTSSKMWLFVTVSSFPRNQLQHFVLCGVPQKRIGVDSK